MSSSLCYWAGDVGVDGFRFDLAVMRRRNTHTRWRSESRGYAKNRTLFFGVSQRFLLLRLDEPQPIFNVVLYPFFRFSERSGSVRSVFVLRGIRIFITRRELEKSGFYSPASLPCFLYPGSGYGLCSPRKDTVFVTDL